MIETNMQIYPFMKEAIILEYDGEITAEGPMLPPSSDHPQGIQEEAKKPRLSLKLLHGLICQLQNENLMLADRLVELETRLPDHPFLQNEVAATADLPVEPAISRQPTLALEENQPQPIRISRSELYPAHKETFWSILPFRKRK
jgi:hypothetical protein